jgi:hypothetical protein
VKSASTAESESGATVRIRPPGLPTTKPPAVVSAEDETQVGVQTLPASAPAAAAEKAKITLKLKKEDEVKPGKRELVLPPGLGEKQAPPPPVEQTDSAATIAVTPVRPPTAAAAEAGADAASATIVVSPADQTVSIGKKKSLRIQKPGKGKEDETSTADAADASAAASAAEAPEAEKPKAPEAGPSRLAAAAALLAFAGIGALLLRLLLDFRRYL